MVICLGERDKAFSNEPDGDAQTVCVSLRLIRKAVVGEIAAHRDAISGPYATLSEFEARLIAGGVLDRLLAHRAQR